MKEQIKRMFPNLAKQYRHFKMDAAYRIKCRYTPAQIRRALEKQYQKSIGVPLNLYAPVRYTEKIQWTKLYGVTEQMSLLSDKYRVREWVKETIGEEYLLPLITAVRSFEEIDFDALPQRFVIKANNASGWNIIVEDKSKLDKAEVKAKLDYWKKTNYAYYSNFEMQYKTIEPMFVIEEYVSDSHGELNDYKFLCFEGKPYYCWVDADRFTHHTRSVYDMNWTLQPFRQYYDAAPRELEKPQGFEEMVQAATTLCQGFPHVRVDLYNVDGKIYFGEMTFTNGDGFERYEPDEYDTILGNLFPISK